MGKIYQVLVSGFRGDKLTIDLCNTQEQMESMTVLQLKEKIAQRIAVSAGENSVVVVLCLKCVYSSSSSSASPFLGSSESSRN